VDGEGLGDGEFFHRFGEDAFAFFLGEDGVVGVVELGDIAPFMVVADEALKDDEGAAGGILHVSAEGWDVEGGGADLKHDEKN